MPGDVGVVESVNVGSVRVVAWRGREVATGIWKSPVAGRVRVRGVNLAGDDQADRTVHGGPDKAVYAYALEDVDRWVEDLGQPLAPGAFGENLTIRGLPLTAAVVGERWRIGSAVLQVSQPRVPCYKLGIRMDDDSFPRRFARAGRPGAYLRILVEGEVGAGDRVAVEDRPDHGVTVGEVADVYHRHGRPGRLLEAPELSPEWREWAAHLLARQRPPR